MIGLIVTNIFCVRLLHSFDTLVVLWIIIYGHVILLCLLAFFSPSPFHWCILNPLAFDPKLCEESIYSLLGKRRWMSYRRKFCNQLNLEDFGCSFNKLLLISFWHFVWHQVVKKYDLISHMRYFDYQYFANLLHRKPLKLRFKISVWPSWYQY